MLFSEFTLTLGMMQSLKDVLSFLTGIGKEIFG